MHEFHAWVALRDSTFESDIAVEEVVAERLRQMIAEDASPCASFSVENFNGQYFLQAIGFINRRRDEGARLEALLDEVVRSLPGSYGLVYEADDEMPVPPGPNAFRVRIIARGTMTERLDPFLSPFNPVIED